MKIYVAGPLNASSAPGYIKNCAKMLSVAVALRRMGHHPFVPCLDILLGFVAGDWEYEDYAGMNLPFVDVCDAFYCIAHSPGTDRELERAKKGKKKIYYSLSEVPAASLQGRES